jgi:hypothetical protein
MSGTTLRPASGEQQAFSVVFLVLIPSAGVSGSRPGPTVITSGTKKVSSGSVVYSRVRCSRRRAIFSVSAPIA